MEKIKNLCIIQARMRSTRLPGKVLLKINGVPLLEYEIKRIQQAKLIDKIVVATSVTPADDKIVNFCRRLKISFSRGSENDVLARYFECAKEYPGYQNIIRITGDCPLIDPAVIDQGIRLFMTGKFDYAGNLEKETFPDGMDMEIFKLSVLAEAASKAKLASEREHVTLYIRNRKKFKKGDLLSPHNFAHFRLTVDNIKDLETVDFLAKNSKINDSYLTYISLLTKNPEIMAKNIHIVRNEGLQKSLKNDFKIK